MNEELRKLIELLIRTRNEWLYGDNEKEDQEILLTLSAIVGAIEYNFKKEEV